MTRKDGLLLVGLVWGLLGAWTALFLWPVWAGIGWLVSLATLMLYLALFVWPKDSE